MKIFKKKNTDKKYEEAKQFRFHFYKDLETNECFELYMFNYYPNNPSYYYAESATKLSTKEKVWYDYFIKGYQSGKIVKISKEDYIKAIQESVDNKIEKFNKLKKDDLYYSFISNEHFLYKIIDAYVIEHEHNPKYETVSYNELYYYRVVYKEKTYESSEWSEKSYNVDFQSFEDKGLNPGDGVEK